MAKHTKGQLNRTVKRDKGEVAKAWAKATALAIVITLSVGALVVLPDWNAVGQRLTSSRSGNDSDILDDIIANLPPTPGVTEEDVRNAVRDEIANINISQRQDTRIEEHHHHHHHAAPKVTTPASAPETDATGGTVVHPPEGQILQPNLPQIPGAEGHHVAPSLTPSFPSLQIPGGLPPGTGGGPGTPPPGGGPAGPPVVDGGQGGVGGGNQNIIGNPPGGGTPQPPPEPPPFQPTPPGDTENVIIGEQLPPPDNNYHVDKPDDSLIVDDDNGNNNDNNEWVDKPNGNDNNDDNNGKPEDEIWVDPTTGEIDIYEYQRGQLVNRFEYGTKKEVAQTETVKVDNTR